MLMAGKTKKVKGTKQTLEFVEAQPKLHVKQLKCMNASQKIFSKAIDSKTVVFAEGPAGAGKTYVALSVGLKLLEKNQVEQIVLVKSAITLPDENLGFLPGTADEKLEPTMLSFFGNIDKIIGESERKRLIAEKKLVIQPLAYVRGITLDRSYILVDEAQNLSLSTFKSIITRIGKDSKYVIMGDTSQTDFVNKSKSVLPKLMNTFEDTDNIGIVRFDENDCVRNPIIPYMLNKIKDMEIQDIKIKNKK